MGSIYSSSLKCVHFYVRFRTVCSRKTDYIILTIQCVYFYIRLHTIYSCKTCKTRGVPPGPHVFYMFYMNILCVIGCKNIHTVLLKLYNQFYVNILYEIVSKNVNTFMKKNIWTPCVFLFFFTFFERILYKSNCIMFIFS